MKICRVQSLAFFASTWILSASICLSAQNISLTVDATKTQNKILHAHLLMPVKPGPLTVYYPKWIPGEHGPDGPIANLTGLKFSADGKVIPWQRDLLDVFTFHVVVPDGASQLEANYDYIEPDGGSATDKLLILEWNEVALYPEGTPADKLMYEAKLIMPDGWKFGSSLPVASQSGNEVAFKPISFDLLVDSPVATGIYYRNIDITPPGEPIHHQMDIVADSEDALNMSPKDQKAMTNLVAESGKLFGARHYRDYHFILGLSDHVAHFGLEHHESNDSRLPENALIGPGSGMALGGLLAHEFVHSWNGKFRRPADLWTPNFNVPMRDSLLWVYEGMTQYWGTVLTARAGIRTPEQSRDVLARVAAGFEISPGREWRPLLDTTNQPTVSQRRPVTWVSWQLPENYYTEGELIWLDADTKIRELTHEQKSLDDVAKKFFGVYNGSFVTQTYTLDDLVNVFNGVAPYDWATFFRQRVYDLHPTVPEDGFTRGGYKLVYSDTMPAWMARSEGNFGSADFSTSLGFSVGVPRRGQAGSEGEVPSGTLGNVWWNSPAFKAGVTPDMQIVSVDGKAFTPEVLRGAILQAEKTKQPIELLFRRGDEYKSISIPYFGGLRIPSLQRVEGTPDRLSDIFAPSKSPLPAM